MKPNNSQLKKFTIAFIMLFTITLFSAEAPAQEKEKGFILSMTEFTIKKGHDNQFKEGIKAWKACYIEAGGTWTWNIWSRLQGNGNVYIMTSTMDKWAEMDEKDEAGMKCRDLAKDLIFPHVESTERNFARFMPEYSNTYPNPADLLWVTSFQVENWAKFKEIIKEITDAVTQAEGSPRGYWYSVMGGDRDNEDFFVSTPFRDFAAMDVDRDNVWTIYENANGKKKRDEMQAEFREATKEIWSYMYKRIKEISHNP
jgi:hypothetical protein